MKVIVAFSSKNSVDREIHGVYHELSRALQVLSAIDASHYWIQTYQVNHPEIVKKECYVKTLQYMLLADGRGETTVNMISKETLTKHTFDFVK